MIDLISSIIILCISTTLYTGTSFAEGLKKNEEYVCVRWSGSADPTQRSPSICITWEKKEKPLHRRT